MAQAASLLRQITGFLSCAKGIFPLFYNIHKVMTRVMIPLHLICMINAVMTSPSQDNINKTINQGLV